MCFLMLNRPTAKAGLLSHAEPVFEWRRLEADVAALIAMLALDVNRSVLSTACICDQPSALLVFAQQMLANGAHCLGYSYATA